MTVSSQTIVIADANRTPFGRFGGSLAQETPVKLATYSASALLKRMKLDPNDIDQVLFANVLPSTTDTLYAGRHLALNLGCKISTPGKVVNRLCGSGIEVLSEAKDLISLGKSKFILCSGAENMSMAPHLTYGARFGTKYGGLKNIDMLLDTLTDSRCQTPMGITAENLASEYKVSRTECDEYALLSHTRAVSAYKNDHLSEEIINYSDGRVNLESDEHVRADASLDQMQKLRANFLKDGTVTAANASGIVDGAANCVVTTLAHCRDRGLSPLVEIVATSVVGVEPSKMGIGPVPAIEQLLAQVNLKISDIDLFEINEAFAPQLLACQKALKIEKNRLNIWGGAIAIGHPLGATGLRITQTLARQMRKENLQYGIASACIGGGQGIAILLKSIK